MSAGVWVLMIVLVVAQLAALLWRRRALEWRRNEAWLARLEFARRAPLETRIYMPRVILGCDPSPQGATFGGVAVYAAPAGTMPDDVAAYVLGGFTTSPVFATMRAEMSMSFVTTPDAFRAIAGL